MAVPLAHHRSSGGGSSAEAAYRPLLPRPGILLGAGVPITTSFEVIMGFIDNCVFNEEAVAPVVLGIHNGVSMARTMQQGGYFPAMAGMIEVGEATGNLATMLTRASIFYDEQVEHALEVFLQLIEPVMVAAMA